MTIVQSNDFDDVVCIVCVLGVMTHEKTEVDQWVVAVMQAQVVSKVNNVMELWFIMIIRFNLQLPSL